MHKTRPARVSQGTAGHSCGKPPRDIILRLGVEIKLNIFRQFGMPFAGSI
jgi:hypothetical protein